MKIKELQAILDQQPSVSANTFFVMLLYVLSWVLMFAFFVLAAGLFLESIFHFKIFLEWVSVQLHFDLNIEQRFKIATSFGLVSLFLSIVFAGFIFVSKMVLTRNNFIIQLEDWIIENVKEINVKKKTK